MFNILFISNGHGEDQIALAIINALKSLDQQNIKFYVLPQVGEGKIFREEKIEIIGPQKKMPSGGFVKSLHSFWKDLNSGLFFLHIKQIQQAKKFKYDLIVSVGDFFPFIVSALFLSSKKRVLISTAKSDLFESHFWLECFFIKKFQGRVLVRDKITELNLKKFKVDAKFLGNVMMDFDGINFRNQVSKIRLIGVLPGSRDEAYANFKYIKNIISKLAVAEVMVAVSSELNPQFFNGEGVGFKILRVSFKELLLKADLVIGMAGTANEQVIGCGIPLITFPGKGPQSTFKRLKDQYYLLGRLPYFIASDKPKDIYKNILKALSDKEWQRRVLQEGPVVMGKPGASINIAEYLQGCLKTG